MASPPGSRSLSLSHLLLIVVVLARRIGTVSYDRESEKIIVHFRATVLTH